MWLLSLRKLQDWPLSQTIYSHGLARWQSVGWNHLWLGCLSTSTMLGSCPSNWKGPSSNPELTLQNSCGCWRWIHQLLFSQEILKLSVRFPFYRQHITRFLLSFLDKLPGLTVVNISDSCFQARRLAHQQSPEFAFTKAHSLLSQGSKLASKFQGR